MPIKLADCIAEFIKSIADLLAEITCQKRYAKYITHFDKWRQQFYQTICIFCLNIAKIRIKKNHNLSILFFNLPFPFATLTLYCMLI